MKRIISILLAVMMLLTTVYMLKAYAAEADPVKEWISDENGGAKVSSFNAGSGYAENKLKIFGTVSGFAIVAIACFRYNAEQPKASNHRNLNKKKK